MLATASIVLFIGAQCLLALANTGIVNFSASEDVDAPIPEAATWLTLHPGAHEMRLHIRPAPADTPLHQVCEDPSLNGSAAPCEHELWVVLDLDDARWARHTKFTLRISWPASSPTDFAIQLFAPSALVSHRRRHGRTTSGPALSADLKGKGTRRKYARIRLVEMGVRESAARRAAPPVPFILLLEPLYLGVLPASMMPILALLSLVAGAAAIFSRVVHRYLEKVAQRVRAESMDQTGEKAEKDA